MVHGDGYAPTADEQLLCMADISKNGAFERHVDQRERAVVAASYAAEDAAAASEVENPLSQSGSEAPLRPGWTEEKYKAGETVWDEGYFGKPPEEGGAF